MSKSTRQETSVAAEMESFKVIRVDGEDFIGVDNDKARIKKDWDELFLMISCGKVLCPGRRRLMNQISVIRSNKWYL